MARVEIYYDKAQQQVLTPVEQNLIRVGQQMVREIKMSMKKEGGGETYLIGKERNIEHVASAPGEPPAVMYGRLRASISINWSNSGLKRGVVDAEADAIDGIGTPAGERGYTGGNFTVVVGTNVTYAPFLEFGTSRMEARPYLRPVYFKYKLLIAKYLKSLGLSTK